MLDTNLCMIHETSLSITELWTVVIYNTMPTNHKDFIVWQGRGRKRAEKHSCKNSRIIPVAGKERLSLLFNIHSASEHGRSHKEIEQHTNRTQGRERVSTYVLVYVSQKLVSILHVVFIYLCLEVINYKVNL